MMARRRKRSKKWIYWIVFLLLLVGAGVVSYLVWDNYFKADDNGGGSEEVEDVEGGADINATDKGSSDGNVEKEKVVQYDGQYSGGDPNNSSELTGVVTYAGISGETLMVRVNIDQYLTSGDCGLKLVRNGGVVYSDEAEIIDSAATSTCEGFNVPVSGLGSGALQIVVDLDSGGKSGVIYGEVEL